MHRELLAQGDACNRKTVEKLMCQAGLRAKTCRRFRVADHRFAARIADRPQSAGPQFQPAARHQAWTMDITYIPTDEGWLYLALVEDLYSRKIVGWSMSERIDSELVVAALNMALEQERPAAGLLAHSDRGVQYASDRFQQLLARARHRVQHEPQGQLLGQRSHRIAVRHDQERTGAPRALRHPRRRRASRCSSTSKCSTTANDATRRSTTKRRTPSTTTPGTEKRVEGAWGRGAASPPNPKTTAAQPLH